jgi:hypothetical protein
MKIGLSAMTEVPYEFQGDMVRDQKLNWISGSRKFVRVYNTSKSTNSRA